MRRSAEELRQEYLAKVRAVEKTKEYLESQRGVVASPTAPTVGSTGFQGEINVPAGSFSFPASAFTPQQLAKYPGMLSDLANHAMKVGSSIDISTTAYAQRGRIPLPTGNRSAYCATVCKYIMDHGGVKSCGLYEPIDTKKFNFNNYNGENPDSMWFRKDFLYYLEILQSKVAPILGVDKITITSGYRSPYYNYDLYSRYLANGTTKKRVYWSPHLGGYAVDIATGSRAKTNQVVAVAESMGFGGIGIANTFVHLDIGPKDTWYY